jgi:outer membrane receptor protein involved in Fe transport
MLFMSVALAPSAAAKSGSVGGVIFTVDANHVRTVWPNARVTLKNPANGTELSTISNDLGVYSFSGVLYGDYDLTVTLAGFEALTKRINIAGDAPRKLDFELKVKGETQQITVSADTPTVDLASSSGGAPILTAKDLKSVVELNQDFQDALPLLPGVVRGPDGLIRIKGGRTNQANTLVNSASVTDPFTGQAALSLPAVAVQSVQVLSNPFSAEYGKFASGVVEVNTRSGTDEWKFLFEDPIPRFRWIGGQIYGVESASPHFTFAGPLKKRQLYLFQSVGYGYDTLNTYSIPDPDNVRIVEKINSYTQVDWNPTANQRFSASLALDPQDTFYATINTFNPQPVTASYRQRSYFVTATHRWIMNDGGFLQTLFAAKQLNSRVYPADPSAGEMTLNPYSNSGSYFTVQDRSTNFYQWSQTLHWRPVQKAGRHLLTAGYSYGYSGYNGNISNLPVTVQRGDGTTSSIIRYDGGLASQAMKNEFAFFVQDNWQIFPRLTLDLGLRIDHDSLSSEAVNVAPRLGFVFAPTRDGKTAIRGGVGLFYDKIPFNVSIFDRYPAQTITRYAADGTTVIAGPSTFTHTVPGAGLQLPYSVGWSLQFDRELVRNVLLRIGYEGRQGHRDFILNPVELPTPQLQLLNSGTQTYHEFLTMVRWQFGERSSITGSYVYSQAHGDLNDYNRYFGNFPAPLIRPNEYGPLASNAPNRGLFWGVIALPYKFDFVPILDVHTGFPHSALDQNWNYLGKENQAGLFPTFIGFDAKLQYPVDFKFKGHHIEFRAGLTVYNVLNHYNPRDVQEYFSSPLYGTFYNSVPRLWRIDGDFTF